jgi:uncharacterized protein involved in exopolysaccharide biosynthesis
MSTIFDTLTYVKRLREAGESEAVAEAHAMAVKDLVLDQVATKDDIALLRAELEAKIENETQRLEAKIEGVEQSLEAKIEGVEQSLEGKIEGVEQRLEAKIEGVEQSLEGKMAQLQTVVHANTRRLEWMIGTVGLGILFLLVRSFWPG